MNFKLRKQMRSFYRCAKCGAMIEALKEGSEFFCCGEPMVQLIPNSVDAAVEKHVPVIVYTDDGVTVKVGSEPHPMEDTHYIEWIEIEYGDRLERIYLHPGEAPEASFKVAAKDVKALIYCNLHGLWVSKNEK
jgi:superoxide reductase